MWRYLYKVCHTQVHQVFFHNIPNCLWQLIRLVTCVYTLKRHNWTVSNKQCICSKQCNVSISQSERTSFSVPVQPFVASSVLPPSGRGGVFLWWRRDFSDRLLVAGTEGGGGDMRMALEGVIDEELLAEEEDEEPRFRTWGVWGALNAERRVLLNNKLWKDDSCKKNHREKH